MFAWPADLPLPFAGAYAPFMRSLSGGPSLSGFEQVQPQLHDRWQATFSFHLGTDARVLALRNLLTRLRGRANTVLLPAFDHTRAPWAADAQGRLLNPANVRRPVLDGTPFADPTRLIDSLITATLEADAALNATFVRVRFAKGGTPLPGHLFSLGSRLHEIDAVTPLGAGLYGFTIWPWLRSDVAAGTVVNFTSPACEMRLASDDEGMQALQALGLKSQGDVTLRFDEASAA